MSDEHQIKAQVVMDFVEMIAAAHESGFVDRNYCSIAEIYRIAQNHCKDRFNVEVPDIVHAWGIETAESLGLNDPKFP